MTVLVLTRRLDPVADMVIAQLNARGTPVHRLDPADFPRYLAVRARLEPGQNDWSGTWTAQHRDLTLGQVTAVYYRRPDAVGVADGVGGETAQWAQEEALAGIGGVLASLRCTWVNHPAANAAAAFEPYTLAVAARCGLLVPRTLVTNDAEEARRFVAELPGGVAAYKGIGAAGPVDQDGRPHALWTTRVRAEEITDAVELTTHQFSEWITKAYEVRLTVVGTRLFAAEIHAGSDAARIDFRRDYDALTYRVCAVPAPVADGVHALMRALDLRYAALDFLVDRRGWHLCDVNANGQWGWIDALRQPIARALADLLEGRP